MILYKLVTRILFVPFVAGISYEIQRWTSYHLDNIFAKIIAVPGMWQKPAEYDESRQLRGVRFGTNSPHMALKMTHWPIASRAHRDGRLTQPEEAF